MLKENLCQTLCCWKLVQSLASAEMCLQSESPVSIHCSQRLACLNEKEPLQVVNSACKHLHSIFQALLENTILATSVVRCCHAQQAAWKMCLKKIIFLPYKCLPFSTAKSSQCELHSICLPYNCLVN